MIVVLEAPRFAVLKASGINRDEATRAAIELAGGIAEIVHIRQLIDRPKKLFDYQGLIIPGGFSYGDHIQSGVVLALEMLKMKQELEKFAFNFQRPVIGVCNGFQALVQSGLLPFGEMASRNALVASLTHNSSGRFESRWIWLQPQEGNICPYIPREYPITLPVDHGEGRFVATPGAIGRIEESGQVVYRYSKRDGSRASTYPDLPNGSTNDIAGITDPTGIVTGMMPHVEDFVRLQHHPNWRRHEIDGKPHGLAFFENIVLYARES